MCRRRASLCAIVGTASMLACVATPRSRTPEFSYKRDVGLVQNARDTTLCLTIANADLAVGDPLVIVSTSRDGPQSAVTARIDARRPNPCTTPGDEWGSVMVDSASFYRVRVTGDSLRGEPAIVLRTNAQLAATGGIVSGDLDGDGRPEQFSQCTSHEGVHFRVTTVVDGREIERWHEYFYVPYDLEPDCPDMR